MTADPVPIGSPGRPAEAIPGHKPGRGARRGIGAGAAFCALAAALLAGPILAGCAQWENRGDSCVMESADGSRRTTNYTDPELCERPVKKRPPDYLRVPPPEEG
jgi:hypothetical protein